MSDELPSAPEEPLGPEQFKQPGSTAPHTNNVVLNDLELLLSGFFGTATPPFTKAQVVSAGLPQAGPREW